jgi:hypothetical protein
MLGICLDEQVIRLGTLTLGAVICRQSVVELAYVGLNAVVGKDILPTGKTENSTKETKSRLQHYQQSQKPTHKIMLPVAITAFKLLVGNEHGG